MHLKNVWIMRVLVTGINGQLGHDVAEVLKIKGFEVTYYEKDVMEESYPWRIIKKIL